jgi:hypothetical protein
MTDCNFYTVIQGIGISGIFFARPSGCKVFRRAKFCTGQGSAEPGPPAGTTRQQRGRIAVGEVLLWQDQRATGAVGEAAARRPASGEPGGATAPAGRCPQPVAGTPRSAILWKPRPGWAAAAARAAGLPRATDAPAGDRIREWWTCLAATAPGMRRWHRWRRNPVVLPTAVPSYQQRPDTTRCRTLSCRGFPLPVVASSLQGATRSSNLPAWRGAALHAGGCFGAAYLAITAAARRAIRRRLRQGRATATTTAAGTGIEWRHTWRFPPSPPLCWTPRRPTR